MSNQKHCRSCRHLDINTMTDEMYCKLKDYELIRLRWHKNRPDWCPLVKQKIEDTGKSKLAPGNKRHAGRTTDYRNRGIGYKLNYCPECGRKL